MYALKGRFSQSWKLFFTHPQVVPNLYECISSVKLKRRVLVTQQLIVDTDFHMEKKLKSQFFVYHHSSKYFFSCPTEETHTHLEQVEGK